MRWSVVRTLISLGSNWLTSKLTRNSLQPSGPTLNILFNSVVVEPGDCPPQLFRFVGSSGRIRKKSLRKFETCNEFCLLLQFIINCATRKSFGCSWIYAHICSIYVVIHPRHTYYISASRRMEAKFQQNAYPLFGIAHFNGTNENV